ncbi:efflux RND transporter periplasmic adaptor subunit [Candidatus Methylobacter oryzae]|uniref:Efflux RND transporter periplasmic adaptor subunit n=1 Tax=Candidatus Methylobacter oryzae TaxID=2497749 RepID=A0ABY3CB24_9GAMM|nr:efflux RND transporter periplasmic adaptor subunit [Candidatus Methylobacter oryzae]TRW95880.1 efflux RND transporter periplasmic adaptor subunit [Candidatus Methylobacter oryzae]
MKNSKLIGTVVYPMLIAATVAGALLLSACNESTTAEPQPRPVRLITAQYRQTATTARYSGEIRARHESPLAFQVGGKLLKRLVDVGTLVKQGQILAILDPADVRLDEAGATAQVAAAQAELDLARKDLGHLLNLQEKGLASQAALDKRRDQMHAAEARVAAAQASQGSYSRKSGYAELRAEHAGVITAVDAEPGQIVSPGQNIVRLAQTDEKEVVVSVPENHLHDLQAASAVKVNLWAKPKRFYEAKLREVSPGVDAVLRTYTAKVSVPNADAAVALGMTATVHVLANETQPVAWLPLTALTQDNGQPAVWVFDPATGTVQPRTVNLAAYDDEKAKVLGGVNEGERVVTAGVHKLVAGQKVRVLGEQR